MIVSFRTNKLNGERYQEFQNELSDLLNKYDISIEDDPFLLKGYYEYLVEEIIYDKSTEVLRKVALQTAEMFNLDLTKNAISIDWELSLDGFRDHFHIDHILFELTSHLGENTNHFKSIEREMNKSSMESLNQQNLFDMYSEVYHNIEGDRDFIGFFKTPQIDINRVKRKLHPLTDDRRLSGEEKYQFLNTLIPGMEKKFNMMPGIFQTPNGYKGELEGIVKIQFVSKYTDSDDDIDYQIVTIDVENNEIIISSENEKILKGNAKDIFDYVTEQYEIFRLKNLF